MILEVQRRRFSVDEYHRMAATGILHEDDRVELIEGEIVEMTPIGRRHMAAVDYLNRRVTQGCGDRAIVRIQGAVRLSPQSEPQPDLLLLKPRTDFYRNADAGPDDVLLLVEVAETSLDYDRTVKARLYGRAGIAEYWLVDLDGGQIEIHRTPSPDGYRDLQRRPRGEPIAPGSFPDITVTVADIVG